MNSYFVWLEPVYIPTSGSVWEAIFTLQEGCEGVAAAVALDNSCLMTTHIFSSIGRVILAAVVGFAIGNCLWRYCRDEPYALQVP